MDLRSHPSRSRTTRSRTAGLTLIELTVAITVMVIALCATASTVVTTNALNTQSHENAVARKAAESMMEALRNTPIDTVFRRFNADPSDDPGAAGTAPGATFAVEGLTPPAGAPGGVAGQIFFPSTGPQLRENVVNASLGMPRDLTGDILIDNFDHAADYRILPVRVRVSWTGKSGPRSIELQTLLSGL
jgi:type II secretory pathway pseudopilin PulG